MEARGWHRVFPHCPPYLWIKFSHQRGRQTEQPASGSSCFLPTMWTDYKLRVSRILTWVLGVLCPGPHSYIASPLLTNVVCIRPTYECVWCMHVCVHGECMSVCVMHACECAWYMHVSVQICICTCGGLRKLLNVFLYSLCLIGLEQSLTHQTLTSQRTPSILLSLPPKAGGTAHKFKLGFIPVLSIRTQAPAQPYGCHFDLHLTSS